MAKKPIIYQTGITKPKGYKVIGGVFKLVGTHGLPLEVVLMDFKEHNLRVDWLDYIKYALLDGANIETVKSRIEAAVGDVCGPKHKAKVVERMNHWYP